MKYHLLKEDSICAFVHQRNGHSFKFMSGFTKIHDIHCDMIQFQSIEMYLDLTNRNDFESDFTIANPTWLTSPFTSLHKRDYETKKLTIEDIIKQNCHSVDHRKFMKWKDVPQIIRDHIENWELDAGDMLLHEIKSHLIDNKFMPESTKYEIS